MFFTISQERINKALDELGFRVYDPRKLESFLEDKLFKENLEQDCEIDALLRKLIVEASLRDQGVSNSN